MVSLTTILCAVAMLAFSSANISPKNIQIIQHTYNLSNDFVPYKCSHEKYWSMPSTWSDARKSETCHLLEHEPSSYSEVQHHATHQDDINSCALLVNFDINILNPDTPEMSKEDFDLEFDIALEAALERTLEQESNNEPEDEPKYDACDADDKHAAWRQTSMGGVHATPSLPGAHRSIID